MKKIQKPVAIFDIDGTIFRNSLLIELHWKMVKAGIIPRSAIKKLDERYWSWVTRKGSYDEYLLEVIESFNEFIIGVPTSTIANLAKQVVKTQSSIVYRYTRALVTKLRKTHQLVAISGSPQIVVREFARAWDFDYYIGTQHAIKNGAFARGPIWVASDNKKEALRKLQDQHDFIIGKRSVGVGDTVSDVAILDMVSVPICLNPTAELYQVAARRGWKVVLERKNAVYEITNSRVLKAYGK